MNELEFDTELYYIMINWRDVVIDMACMVSIEARPQDEVGVRILYKV